MTIVLIILCVVLFIWATNSKRKIDEEEKKARNTPGIAQYIRDNFQEIVNCVSSAPGIKKDFERTDYIRFVNSSSGQKIIMQKWSGNLKLGVVMNNSMVKEWDISVKDKSPLLISEIMSYIGSYSYWDIYKDKNVRKAEAIVKLTRINMSKESDKDAKEIIESIERWAINTGKSITELRQNFIESAVNTFGEDNLDFLINRMKDTEMAKEAATFDIEEEHTICHFMIDILQDYINNK